MHGEHFNQEKSMILDILQAYQVVWEVSCWHKNVD